MNSNSSDLSKTLALYKSFTYLLTYVRDNIVSYNIIIVFVSNRCRRVLRRQEEE